MLTALYVFKIFKFFSDTFSHMGKQTDKITKVN